MHRTTEKNETVICSCCSCQFHSGGFVLCGVLRLTQGSISNSKAKHIISQLRCNQLSPKFPPQCLQKHFIVYRVTMNNGMSCNRLFSIVWLHFGARL